MFLLGMIKTLSPFKNRKVETIHQWGPEFKVSFDLKIMKLGGDAYKNIFHFTSTGNNCCNIGDRLPVLTLHKSGALYMGTQIGNAGNKNIQTAALDKDKLYKIELEQDFNDGKVGLKMPAYVFMLCIMFISFSGNSHS